MSRIRKKDNSADRFWEWFGANSFRYITLNQTSDLRQKELLLDKLLKKLHSFCKHLSVEVGGKPGESQELIISASGNYKYFEHVVKLIENAPKIVGWKIIAFKPPMGTDFILEYKGIKLDPNKIWFLPLENESMPRGIGLRLCIPGFSVAKKDVMLEACYQLLDTILGEHSANVDIQHVEVDKLPSSPIEEGMIELNELVKYISWKKSKIGL